MGREEKIINVISSCVCRDAFEIGERATKRFEYKIEVFYQATCPFSLYSAIHPEALKLKEENLVFGSPWQRRLLIAEIRKAMFLNLGESKRSSHVVLDFTDFCKSLYSLDGEEKSYILETAPSKGNYKLFEKYCIEKIDPWNLPREYITSCLDRYASDIARRYEADKIIICRVFHVGKYLENGSRIEEFNTPLNKLNDFIAYCYDYIIKALAGMGVNAHVIEMPKNTIADDRHKWGNYTLHFHSLFYEYLFSAIDVVCAHLDKETEARALASLLEGAEAAFDNLISRVLFQSERGRLVALNHNAEEIEKDNEYLRFELDKIKRSRSYKIGRMITYIPRKLFKRKKG